MQTLIIITKKMRCHLQNSSEENLRLLASFLLADLHICSYRAQVAAQSLGGQASLIISFFFGSDPTEIDHKVAWALVALFCPCNYMGRVNRFGPHYKSCTSVLRSWQSHDHMLLNHTAVRATALTRTHLSLYYCTCTCSFLISIK
jgi:hypothetical protein